MSLARAGGLTTMILASLITAVLIWFARMRLAFDTWDVVERVFFFFPVSLLGIAPITMLVFPLMHVFLRSRGPVGTRTFALTGAVLGALVTGYVLVRFRGAFFPTMSISFVAIPMLTLVGAVAGLFSGYLFIWLAGRGPLAEARERRGDVTEV